MRGNSDVSQGIGPCVWRHWYTSMLDRELRCLEGVLEARLLIIEMLEQGEQIWFVKEHGEAQQN